ncbi:MAG: HAMP domain-containing histidine kinase [Bacteroidetes bacterium]|nr:HAMP domain-containing histidine kinase [Bacteroidota bacterium]
MKLITKTTLLYLLITLFTFAIGGFITFNIIKLRVDKETDFHLKDELFNTYHAIELGAPIHTLNNYRRNIVELPSGPIAETRPAFSDTLVFHKYLKRTEVHRKAVVSKQIGEKLYKISIYDLVVEQSDIYDAIFSSMTKIFAILTVLAFVTSFLISHQLFRPFYQTLQRIRNFRLQQNEPISFSKTKTKEFTDLNAFVTNMTTKVRQDYINLKEFNENASHEMQTPLAVAKGKLEILLEQNHLSNEQISLIQSAYSSIHKLSYLGRSLSLLSKIENQEFANSQTLNFSSLINQLLFDLKELIELKNLSLKTQLEEEVLVFMDPILADILITNLLRNSIKHNQINGNISVKLTQKSLTIANSGKAPSIPPEKLFERFRKSNQSGESPGLGLAIVKEICKLNHFKINYVFEDGLHLIKVVF